MVNLTKMEKQVILYSKNWFKKMYLLNDLRVFVSKEYKMEFEDTFDCSIYHFISELWLKLFDSKEKYQQFIRELFKTNVQVTYIDIINNMMSDFSNLIIYENDNILIDLGEPDYSLLPKKQIKI